MTNILILGAHGQIARVATDLFLKRTDARLTLYLRKARRLKLHGDADRLRVVLTTISTVDPIKAYFTVSDQRYVAYTRRWANNPEARAEHERQLEYELIMADGSFYPHKGRLFAVDTDIDARTGSQRIVALFPNPGNILRRGQFVRVRMRSEIRQGALLVPQRAVTDLQGTRQVVVVGADNRAEVRPVKAGRRIEQRWIIDEGLKPGERIVVEGMEKARAGVIVNPKPWTPPSLSVTNR